MASILVRSCTSLVRKSVIPRLVTSVKQYSEKIPPYYDPAEGKIASKDLSMPDELGGTVGIERWEALEKEKGIDDPFMLKGLKITPGTKENPTLIPTVNQMRTIGCVCEEDAVVIRYTRLHLGETKRCSCGHFFKLVPVTED